MAAKIEPTERQSAGAAAGSDEQSDQQLRAILENLQHVMKEDEPMERDDLRPSITRLTSTTRLRSARQFMIVSLQ